MTISQFRTTCLAVLEEVRRTGVPVRITRYGKPVAEVVPVAEVAAGSARGRKEWMRSLRNSGEIVGDIVGPIGAFGWDTPRK